MKRLLFILVLISTYIFSVQFSGRLLASNADKYTPVDKSLIPTGEICSVDGTALDFTEPKTIGKDIESVEAQIIIGQAYDHNYVLNTRCESKLNFAARVTGDKSGIQMDVYTEEPGMQFYSGNFMQSINSLKSGLKDDFRTSFALETQHFPDSPNHPNFPSTLLQVGDIYESTSIYKFSISDNI